MFFRTLQLELNKKNYYATIYLNLKTFISQFSYIIRCLDVMK